MDLFNGEPHKESVNQNQEYWYYMELYAKTFGDMFPNMCMPDEKVIENIKNCLKTGEEYEYNLPPGTVV